MQVIAYVMKEFGWSLDRTLQYVKQRRPCVKPNPGFLKQLFEYEGILNAKLVTAVIHAHTGVCLAGPLLG